MDMRLRKVKQKQDPRKGTERELEQRKKKGKQKGEKRARKQGCRDEKENTRIMA